MKQKPNLIQKSINRLFLKIYDFIDRKNQKPERRFGTKKAIEELVAQYGYEYEGWMQDWPLEIADFREIENYFLHYDEQTDDDKKFSLMEMLIFALTDIENDADFNKYWELLRGRLIKDFEIHVFTVFNCCCFEQELSESWNVAPNMRLLWNEFK